MVRKTLVRMSALAAIAALCAGPSLAQDFLTDDQMDRLSAGTITLGGVATAQATGVLALTQTGAQGVTVHAKGPGVTYEEIGVVSVNAAADGSNLGVQGAPPPTSSASTATSASSDSGNVYTFGVSRTLTTGSITGSVAWRVIYANPFIGI
jgi:hypothetical protein